MIKICWTGFIILTSGLLLCGCKKTVTTPPVNAGGVSIDMAKLQRAMTSGPAEVKSRYSDVRFALRYTDYDKAGGILEEVAANPGLNDQQKKDINDVLAQVKQAAANKAAAPPQ
jgi:hypothetical protein